MLGQRFDTEEQRQRVAQLAGELATLQQIAAQEQAVTAAAQERAHAGRAAAEAERRADQLAQQRRKAEERQTKERKPADDAAKRMAEADAKAIATLARQLETFGDDRQRAIDQALARLSEGATAQQRAEVERYAGEIHDLGEAKKAEAEAERERQQLMREGARITEDALSPLARLSAEVQNLNRLQAEGAITVATHSRAVADAIAEAEEKALAESADWQAGMTRGMRDYADEALNAAAMAEKGVTGAFEGMENAMLAFAATGKVEFATMVDAMMAELARLTLRMAVFAPLAKAAGRCRLVVAVRRRIGCLRHHRRRHQPGRDDQRRAPIPAFSSAGSPPAALSRTAGCSPPTRVEVFLGAASSTSRPSSRWRAATG